jgi:hypothetical protein
VYVLGAATAGDHAFSMTQMPDLATTPGAVCGPAALAMAGMTPADVDVLETYDSFTITALLHLEDLGFCAKGEGGPFVEDGNIGPGGAFPMNTNGGGLSYTSGPVRDVHPRRGSASVAGRVWRSPGRRRRGRHRPRFGRAFVDIVDVGTRQRGDWMKLYEPPERTYAEPFWDGTRQHELVLPACRQCDVVFWYPREVCPTCLGTDIEWRPAAGDAMVYARGACSTGRGRRDGRRSLRRSLVDLPEGAHAHERDRLPARTLRWAKRCAPRGCHLSDGRNLPMFTPAE